MCFQEEGHVCGMKDSGKWEEGHSSYVRGHLHILLRDSGVLAEAFESQSSGMYSEE